MKKINFIIKLLVILYGSSYAQEKTEVTNLAKLRFDSKASMVFISDIDLKTALSDESLYSGELPIDTIKGIDMKRSHFGSIDLSGNQEYPKLKVSISESCEGENLILNSFSAEILINNCQINRLDFSNCSIQSLNIQNTQIQKLVLSEALGVKSLYISRNTFCDTIDLRGFSTGPNSILSAIAVSRKNMTPTTLIFDYSTRFDKLDIDLSQYNLQMDEFCNDCKNKDSYHMFFTTELAYLKEKGQEKNHKTLYYLYRKWLVKDSNFIEKIFSYYLPEQFYGFGLKKILILRSSLVLLLLSFLLLIIFYRKVITAYDFELDETTTTEGNTLSRVYIAFILTAIVFFSFKMDHTKMRYENSLGLFIIVLVFTLGLICYAFLANFIFTFK